MERLEPTRNPKQPESMLAKGNTSHIKKTHWKIKLLERLELTRNPKQLESMLAKGNTSHIKKAHWKYQTAGETGTHKEPQTTWIDACKGNDITHQENALEISNYWRDWNPHGTQNNLNRCLQRGTHHTSRKRTENIKLLKRLEPTRNPKQPESMLVKGNTSHQENALEISNYWRDWNPQGTPNNLNRCLQRETHHTSRKRTGNIKLLERLEPTRNPKQPESMLAKGNTSHIKKTHWKNQTT